MGAASWVGRGTEQRAEKNGGGQEIDGTIREKADRWGRRGGDRQLEKGEGPERWAGKEEAERWVGKEEAERWVGQYNGAEHWVGQGEEAKKWVGQGEGIERWMRQEEGAESSEEHVGEQGEERDRRERGE